MRHTASIAFSISAALLPASAPAQTRIPLCPGLTYVGSVSGPGGDYEPIVKVEAVTAHAVELSYSAQVQTSSGILNNDTKRTVLLEDVVALKRGRLVQDLVRGRVRAYGLGATA